MRSRAWWWAWSILEIVALVGACYGIVVQQSLWPGGGLLVLAAVSGGMCKREGAA